MCLLPARDECLMKETADRLATVQPEMTGARSQAEDLVGPRRPEPLELDRQLGGIEVLPLRPRRKRMTGQSWRWRLERRHPVSVDRPKPLVRRPHHRLNRRFPSQRASAAIAKWPSAQIDHIGLATLRFDQIRMTSPLQRRVRSLART